jgi:hypothetical protein
VRPGPSSCPYSPECVEVEFCEVHGSKLALVGEGYGMGVGLYGFQASGWRHAGRICGENLLRAGTGCCVPTSGEFMGQAQLDSRV